MPLSPRLRKSIRWALLIVFGPIALVLLALVVMVVFRIPVPLNGLRPAIEQATTGALKRETRIEGPLKLYLGLHPAVQLEGFHIANPHGWPGGGDFIQLDRLRAKIGLVNLLNKRIDIDEFHVEGVEETLQRNAEGRHNWRLLRGLGGEEPEETTSGDTGPAVPPADQVQDENKKGVFDFVQVREVSIRDIELRELYADGKPKFFLALDRAEGNAATGKKLALSLEGALDDAPFKGDLSANPLDELIDTDNLWPFAFKGGFAGVALNLDGELASPKTSDTTVINFTVEADDLKKLHPFTGPLPDLGAVNLKGQATATPGGYHVPQLTGAVGETTVNGQLDIKLGGETPHIDGSLDLGVLDVAIFKSDKEGEVKPAASPSPSPSPGVNPSPPPDTAVLPFTGKLRLSLAELKNPKVSVKNLVLGFEARENEAVASVSVDFAEAPLAGAFALREIDLETQEVDLRLEGNKGKFGELIAFFTEQENFEGQFEYLLYHVTGRGTDIGDAWNNRTTVLDVKKAALTFLGEEKTIDFELDRAGIHLDMAILPREVHLDDADFGFAAGKIVFEKRELSDIAFSGQFRDGWMKPAPFRVTIGETALTGDVGIDLRDTEPQAGIVLSTSDVNIVRR